MNEQHLKEAMKIVLDTKHDHPGFSVEVTATGLNHGPEIKITGATPEMVIALFEAGYALGPCNGVITVDRMGD